MNQKTLISAMVLINLLVSSLFGLTRGFQKAAAKAIFDVDITTTTIPEAGDFATENFGDAWDMSQFTDISQYLQGAGRHVSLSNIEVEDGIFSANAAQRGAFFYPLYGGFDEAVQTGGNLGSIHPVDTQKYQCFYIAMKVDSPGWYSGGPAPDAFRVLWYPKQGQYGGALDRLYPEAVGSSIPMVHNWKLYKINLTQPPFGIGIGPKWTDAAAWPGIEIDPTTFTNINFQIDWIRLTGCGDSPQFKTTINWSPDSSLKTIWAHSQQTDQDIQLVSGINGSAGRYDLDTKGLAPGSYQIGLGDATSCCSKWSSNQLTITALPVVTFSYPSPLTGEDYATQAGNSWDMDPSDLTTNGCGTISFADGILTLDTPYPSLLPANCKGSGLSEADVQFWLNLPRPLLKAGDYRYLSFRMYINGDYTVPADGMIGRLIWWTSADDCIHTSTSIPYDVGWHTYTIDLYDSVNGTPVSAARASGGSCSLTPWQSTGQLFKLRFDPNENWTGNAVPAMTFDQKFDWIRLTKELVIPQGQTFDVKITLDRRLNSNENIEYFYTHNRNNPTENLLVKKQLVVENKAAAAGPMSLFIPLATSGVSDPFQLPYADDHEIWDTSGVNTGDYYICAKVSNETSQVTYCSEVPVRIGP